MPNPKDRFVTLLCEFAHTDFTNPPGGERREQLMQTFLDFGSRTEDNVNCYDHVEYGLVPAVGCRPSAYGLKLKGKDIPLVDVLHAVEDLPLPDEIKEQVPNITSKEWEAVTRMATMVFIALESQAVRYQRKE